MSQNRTTPMPEAATPSLPDLLPASETPQEPGYDAERYGYDDDWARQQVLQLRPTYFEGFKHPDRRPCPPWCAGARHPEYEHEIDAEQPAVATHVLNGAVSSRASLYRGAKRSVPDDELTEYAVFLCDLQQIGQGLPTINLALRAYTPDGEVDAERLFKQNVVLTATDAEELIVVLSYMVRLARVGADSREDDWD